ncbi:HAMP domain-containing sensor histidine kinase [Dysgonomonas sp. 25]|uniref:sensor histidine kinase n=1 Tax=Dysgonomonas sp. 25 TaxID=2302933 RepID=UPI0013D32422|nr:HAMP domain-containing sensor histidine kinase [Dysgonomonas sp. 25]NDV70359.1 sensor histidine kinase [Dysgonomonas sp. 25]
MRLVNYLTSRLLIFFLLILTVWSVIYFSLQMREIYEDIDEGLENLRQEFVMKANLSSQFTEDLMKHAPLNMIIEEIPASEAKEIKDTYITTTVYFATEEEEEEVRMLVTAFYSEPNQTYYKLKIFTSNVETEDLRKNMFYLLIALWCALILTLFLLSWIILKRTNKPLFELIGQLRSFHLDKTQMITLSKTNISEFEELNNSVKVLLEENIKVYTEQKNFIENASHELQTPLSVAINKLEMLIGEEGLSKVQVEEVGAVLSELNRMRRLNTNLLLLSKIRNKQYADNEMVDFSELTERIASYFSDMIEHKGLTLSIKQETAPVVDMNKDLAAIMVTNLLKNAVAYNLKDGTIEIVMTDRYIAFSNDGTPIDKDVNIFERYISNSDNKQSSGLGLSIVKSITDFYSFRITHTYDTRHTITIYFS